MNNLKYLRNLYRISLRNLIPYVNITESVLSCLENGKRQFLQSHIDRITAYFDVTSDFLLGKSDVGIKCYLEYTGEEVLLSRSDYNRLQKYIKTERKDRGFSDEFSITIDDENETFTLPQFYLYRTLKSDAVDIVIKNKVLERINKMSNEELKKTLSFIDTYILN